ncbi:unnamed protein product [Effrenium voratum]|nr:unnamed protein product [Effrenium voratum]
MAAGMGGLEGLLGGLAAGGALDAIWENPMVANIAFHPSKIEPSYLDSTGPIRDGTFDTSDGNKISYRFYVPSSMKPKIVVYFFHGNAEVCTAMDDIAEMLHAHGAALLSIDYRGYAWGTGQPSLKKLCADADQCFTASEGLLAAAGFADARRVVFGRSIGATCAVHLAQKRARKVHGLIVDSGLMSIKQLPTVQMLGPMVFQGNTEMFQQLPEPFDTLGKLPAVGCPALVMHGDKDEIVPYTQAVQCHDALKTPAKKLQCWVGATHNDVWCLYAEPWRHEVKTLLEQALEFENSFPAGALVETHSLSAAELNGLQGRILGPEKDRLRVELPVGVKALKPSNLKLLDEEPEKGADDFPIGATVEAHSLSSADLNGRRGKVLGPQNERVQVEFEDGKKALKPCNLKVVECERSSHRAPAGLKDDAWPVKCGRKEKWAAQRAEEIMMPVTKICLMAFDLLLLEGYTARLLKNTQNAYLPDLSALFNRFSISAEFYATQWFLTLFAYSLPFPHVLRVWDHFLCRGVKFIHRVGLALLKEARPSLLGQSFDTTIDRLRCLCQTQLSPEALVASALQFKVTNRFLSELEAAITSPAGLPCCFLERDLDRGKTCCRFLLNPDDGTNKAPDVFGSTFLEGSLPAPRVPADPLAASRLPEPKAKSKALGTTSQLKSLARKSQKVLSRASLGIRTGRSTGSKADADADLSMPLPDPVLQEKPWPARSASVPLSRGSRGEKGAWDEVQPARCLLDAWLRLWQTWTLFFCTWQKAGLGVAG